MLTALSIYISGYCLAWGILEAENHHKRYYNKPDEPFPFGKLFSWFFVGFYIAIMLRNMDHKKEKEGQL